MEKLLKAHVCKTTKDFAPKTHSLLRLAEVAGLDAAAERADFLSRFDQYSIAGRYPGTPQSLPTADETVKAVGQAQEVFRWLMARL